MSVESEPLPWCAALARALHEPLPGTAPVSSRWVAVEHRGTWPTEILRHRDDAVRAFLVRAHTAGWRPVLVRRPGRRPTDGPTRVFLTDTTPPSPRTTVQRVTDPAVLADLRLPEPGATLPGATVGEPMLLVCTHGRRDRCCAIDGRALARTVAAIGGVDVWECTHLGGHRFAPTALVLPTGYVYGRLDGAAAVAAHKAALAGEVEPALCRGRSTWSGPGQVAELAVRDATGLRDANVLRVLGSEPHGDADVVRVAADDGRRWAVTVYATSCAARRPVSCGAAALPVTALQATRVEQTA